MTQQSETALIGAVVALPGGDRALVLDVEHEYDDGTTLRYLTGRNAGSLTMRDTSAVRRYERVYDHPGRDCGAEGWRPAVALRAPRHWPWAQRLVDAVYSLRGGKR